MRKGWDDALELQNAVHHAVGSREYAQYLRWFSSGANRSLDFLDHHEAPKEGSVSETEMQFLAAHAMTMAADDETDPMWVNGEVLELVEYAAESFEPEAVLPTDLIVPQAFCVFERPLHTVDTQGHHVSFRAASWCEFEHLGRLRARDKGPSVALWHHKDDEDDYSLGNPLFRRSVAGCPLLLMQASVIPWADARAMTDPASHELYRQLQVLWRLAKQQVVISGRLQVSRPTWRHKQNWREIKTVQVFTLRRASVGKSVGEQGDGSRYSHRFPVRGHWRNQWYPSEKVHRQIWIDEFVKGPEDKPFVAKRRAVEFVR